MFYRLSAGNARDTRKQRHAATAARYREQCGKAIAGAEDYSGYDVRKRKEQRRKKTMIEPDRVYNCDCLDLMREMAAGGG